MYIHIGKNHRGETDQVHPSFLPSFLTSVLPSLNILPSILSSSDGFPPSLLPNFISPPSFVHLPSSASSSCLQLPAFSFLPSSSCFHLPAFIFLPSSSFHPCFLPLTSVMHIFTLNAAEDLDAIRRSFCLPSSLWTFLPPFLPSFHPSVL